jgi:hypothetical protein
MEHLLSDFRAAVALPPLPLTAVSSLPTLTYRPVNVALKTAYQAHLRKRSGYPIVQATILAIITTL